MLINNLKLKSQISISFSRYYKQSFYHFRYYTYGSINSKVPGIFQNIKEKNNQGITKSLEQFKRQLKTHVLSLLASNQDMINNYGNYPLQNNFSEKDTKNFDYYY